MSFISDLFNPPAANIQLPTGAMYPTNVLNYDPSQIAPTQSSMLGGIGGLSQYNLGGTNLPTAQSLGMGMLNDPTAQFLRNNAMTGANMGMSAAQNQYGAGGAIYGTAFDPQQDLYNRMIQQNTDASRANAMAAGLGTTPIGASSVDWSNQNFNINWQNAQLQRQMQGAQAASGLQAGAMPLFMQGAQYPWQTGQQIGGAGLGTLSNLGQLGIQAAQIPGQQISGWQNALGQMGALQNQAFNQQQGVFQDASQLAQLQLQQNQQAFNQQQTMGQGWGKLIGGLAGAGIGAFGGPAGMMAGASLGSSLGGGTSPSGSGTGWNFSGLPTSWGSPSSPMAQAQPGSYGYYG